MNFRDRCRAAGACQEFLAWLGGLTAEEAWRFCYRADWMLWIVGHLCAGVPEDRLRAYAAYVAELTPLGDGRTTWDLLPDERSRQAVRVASWHAVGLATAEELRSASDAAWDAASAAWAASDAAGYAASAAWAASDAAGYAARAASAAWADSSAAWAYARAWQADALRLHIPDITPYIRKGK